MAPKHPVPEGYGNAGQDFTYIRNNEGHVPYAGDDFERARHEATWDEIFGSDD